MNTPEMPLFIIPPGGLDSIKPYIPSENDKKPK